LHKKQQPNVPFYLQNINLLYFLLHNCLGQSKFGGVILPCTALKPAISALLGLHVLFSPCHHALFISLRPLSVTNAAMQQLACSTPRPRDLMSALSPAVYFQSWDTLYHFNGG